MQVAGVAPQVLQGDEQGIGISPVGSKLRLILYGTHLAPVTVPPALVFISQTRFDPLKYPLAIISISVFAIDPQYVACCGNTSNFVASRCDEQSGVPIFTYGIAATALF